jgi:hypothetical protein
MNKNESTTRDNGISSEVCFQKIYGKKACQRASASLPLFVSSNAKNVAECYRTYLYYTAIFLCVCVGVVCGKYTTNDNTTYG